MPHYVILTNKEILNERNEIKFPRSHSFVGSPRMHDSGFLK